MFFLIGNCVAALGGNTAKSDAVNPQGKHRLQLKLIPLS